ncbi:MAG: hypothetical protein JRI32_05980 [Deltaproteobacteria bacterium]|nr:hypothetical protein [Deltaproteobacteria bacterium]
MLEKFIVNRFAKDFVNQNVNFQCRNTIVEYCSPLLSNYTHLLELNQNESYFDKIIAFGGNEFDGKIPGLDLYNLAGAHKALSTFSRVLAIMPIIPNGYDDILIDESYRPFQANDGMVPLTSALFLEPGAQHLFTVESGELRVKGEKLKTICKNDNFFQVEDYCQCKECIVLKKRVDHLDFLDDRKINRNIREKLKNLIN